MNWLYVDGKCEEDMESFDFVELSSNKRKGMHVSLEEIFTDDYVNIVMEM